MVRDMATNKNDIALSFDKAEYYSLQEASDYLNRKHGIDNVTPKKLLTFLVSVSKKFMYMAAYTPMMNTPCYIDITFDDFDKYNNWQHVVGQLSDFLSISLEEHGGLLALDDRATRQILLFGETTVHEYKNPFVGFANLLPFRNLEALETYARQQYNIRNLRILAIYPYLTVSDIDDLERELKKIKNVYDYDMALVKGSEAYYHRVNLEIKIKIDDLVILHSDLNQLEQFILKGDFDPQANQNIELPKASDMQRLNGEPTQQLQATIDRQAKQIAELEAQIAEQQKTIEQLTEQAAAPTNYTTPALEALAAVIDEFWVSYDPSQPNTAQKQDYIKAWILENHPDLNPSIALWLDKIARHPTAK